MRPRVALTLVSVTVVVAATAVVLRSGARGRASRPAVVVPREVVAFLTSERLQGRAVASAGETLAAQFIASAFESMGLPPPPGAQRFEPFTLTIDGQQLTSHGNVLGWLDAGAPYTLVVGAHYDHLGLGPRHSKNPFTSGVHHGADDNASGVATMLALADRLSARRNRPPFNVLFVAFSGEEEALSGSTALLRSGLISPSTTLGLINFDMVGRMNALRPMLALEGTKEVSEWLRVLDEVPKPPFDLRTDDAVTPGSSDHATFAKAGYPVLSLSTGQSEDYHTPSDELERLNFAAMAQVLEFALTVVDDLGPHAEALHAVALKASVGSRPAPSP